MIRELYSGSGVDSLDAQDFLIQLGERIEREFPEFDLRKLTALENLPQSIELIKIDLPIIPKSKYYVVYKKGESTLVVLIRATEKD